MSALMPCIVSRMCNRQEIVVENIPSQVLEVDWGPRLTTSILKQRLVYLARILGGDALEAFLRSAAYFSVWAHRFWAS